MANAGSSSLRLDLTNSTNGTTASGRDLPPIAALFVIHFDIKAGYTIAWKKAISGVELDGVEYKSLPSGLHNLKEDLVYYIHQEYAGVSAFVNVPVDEDRRNALMLAVGILVPLSYGRLGRSWRHAQNLKDLARAFADDTNDLQDMEEYFDRYKIQAAQPQTPGTPADSPSSLRYRTAAAKHKSPAYDRLHNRHRSISDVGTVLTPGHSLSPHHPALSLPEFILTFGPLIFPLYRYALCRKRILIITDAPVEKPCNFVYDLSILSNIPLAVADSLTVEPARLRPLFCIGVHDIAALEEEMKRQRNPRSRPSSRDAPTPAQGEYGSWVAATTDAVLEMRRDLHDLIVRLPPAHTRLAKDPVWPAIEISATGEQLKATQRDLRRYRALRESLMRYINPPESALEYSSNESDDDNTATAPAASNNTNDAASSSTGTDPRRRFSVSFTRMADTEVTYAHEESVCEKLSWPQLAYSSFIWWASAGEKRQETTEEEDSEGLDIAGAHGGLSGSNDDLLNLSITSASGGRGGGTQQEPASQQSPVFLKQQRRRSTAFSVAGLEAVGPLGNAEMDIIAYFHRMTVRLLGTMAEVIDVSGVENDDDEDEAEEEEEDVDDEGGSGTAVGDNDAASQPLLGNGHGAGSEDTVNVSGDYGVIPPLKGEVFISADDMLRLGLDQFSENDEKFLREIVAKYFGRQAVIDRPGLNLCGWKLC